MSIGLLVASAKARVRIENMNKKEIVECMLGYLENATDLNNDNRNVVYHHMTKIKQIIDSCEKHLNILEAVGVKDKKHGKEYVLKSLDQLKNRIEKLYE